MVYARQGRFDEAEALYRRALTTVEDALGAEHPDAAIMVLNLATLTYERGRYAEAETLVTQALKSSEGEPGPFPSENSWRHAYVGKYLLRSRTIPRG